MGAEFCHLEVKLLPLRKGSEFRGEPQRIRLLLLLFPKEGVLQMWGAVPSCSAATLAIYILLGSSLAISGKTWWHWCLQSLPALWVPMPQHGWASKTAEEKVVPELAPCFHQNCSWPMWHSQLVKCPSLAAWAQSSAVQPLPGLSFLTASHFSSVSLAVPLSHRAACGNHSAKLSAGLSK